MTLDLATFQNICRCAVAVCAASLYLFFVDAYASQAAELTPEQYQACTDGQNFPKQCPETIDVYDDAYVQTMEDYYHDLSPAQVRRLAHGGDLIAQAVALFGLPNHQRCKQVQTIAPKVTRTPLALYVRGYCLWNGFGFSKDQAAGLRMTRRAIVMMPSSGMKSFFLRQYATFISNTPAALEDPSQRAEMFTAIKEIMEQAQENCTVPECLSNILGQAHVLLGEHFQFVEKKPLDAMYHYTKATEFGEPGAMIQTAHIYANGVLGFIDHQRALELFWQAHRRAIALGDDRMAKEALIRRQELRDFIGYQKQLQVQDQRDYEFQRGEWINHKREQDRVWQCINGQRKC